MKQLFMVLGTDKPDAGTLRQQIRPMHRDYIREQSAIARVILAGPTFNDATGEMNGTLLIVEAESVDATRDFINGDPYLKAGLFDELVIRPWNLGLIQEFSA